MTAQGVRGVTFALAAALMTAASSASIAAAQAQQVVQGQFTFDIKAKPVPQAVNDIGRIAGLSVVFRENRPISATGNPVRGRMSAEQALATMLAETGLGYSFSNPTTVQVFEVAVENSAPLSADGATMLDPITIYGARDATSLNDTSASVGIVTAEEIQDSQIRNFRDSFRRMANVMDADWINGGFVIRGVNSEGFNTGANPIGSLYVDGVLQSTEGTRRGARGLWDVEQVEVYRGPQSTLSGRAAMAGAIYIKTKDPTFEKEAEVSATVGNDHLAGTAFMVNTPLLEDQIAMRIAGSFERSKSDLNAPSFTGFDRYDDFMTNLTYNIRGKMLFTPAELPDTKALLSYSFAHDAPTERNIGGPGQGFRWEDKRADYYLPIYTEVRSTKVHNVGLEITHDFSDALQFTSQTGVTHDIHQRPSINEGTPGEVNTLRGDRKNTLFTQEARLNYQGERWKWVGGVFGSHQNYSNSYDGTLGFYNQFQDDHRKITNLAAFGEATYEFLPSWHLTAGGRIDYTKQSTDYFYRMRDSRSPNNPRITDYSGSGEETNFVPKIGISKDFGDDHTVGFSYSQGFRNGGIAYDTVNRVMYNYDPESSHSYEIFYKGSWLDDRLRLNANFFYTQYRDQQVDIEDFANLTNRIANAAGSRAYGFEIEPTWQVTDQLSTFLALGYLNTKFDRESEADTIDLPGFPFPEAPEWSIGLGGRYEFENGFYVGGDAKYTSSYMARFSANTPNSFVGSRTIVNAQAGYRLDGWEINAFAENLLDEEYLTYLEADRMATLGQRRSFGLNVKAKF